MKKINYIWSLIASTGLLMASCAEDYKETIPMPEKPQDVKLAERLASYGVLGEYAAKAGIKLGVGVNADDFAEQGMLYSIIRTNFSEIENPEKVVPMSMWTAESTYDFSAYASLVEAVGNSDMKLFGPVLCTENNIPDDYLNSLIAKVVIPYKPWSEIIPVTDFEDVPVGTKYPSAKKAAGAVAVEIVEDPLGQQGKVLGGTKLTMDLPMITNIKLPDGFTVADISRIRMKCLLVSGTPTSSRFQVESAGYNEKANPYKDKNVWQEYVFDMSNLKLKDTELTKNTFSLAAGAYGSSVTCYIDDISIQLDHNKGEDTVIEKTLEEKKEIISGELYSWVDGIVDACGSIVKDYIIVDEPLDGEFSKFHWSDYVGDKYVNEVQAAVKEKAGADVRFYVSQTLSLGEMMSIDVKLLKDMIDTYENAGVKIDAVNIVLDAVYSQDYSKQIANDAATVDAIKSLATLGKPVRVSNFKVRIVNDNGVQINPTSLTTIQCQAVAEYYELVIGEFLKSLGNNAEAFSLSTAIDTTTDVAPWLQNGNRSFVYEGIVRGLSIKY